MPVLVKGVCSWCQSFFVHCTCEHLHQDGSLKIYDILNWLSFYPCLLFVGAAHVSFLIDPRSCNLELKFVFHIKVFQHAGT